MTRSYTLKDKFKQKQAIGDGRWFVRFSVIEHTDEDVTFVEYTETIVQGEPFGEKIAELEAIDLEQRKSYKKQEVSDYAGSELKAVSINGDDVWFDSEKRASIVRSIEAERNLGQETTKLDVNGTLYTMDIDDALTLMDGIDKYSKDCYIKTVEHQNAIDALTALQDVLAYDFKTGYPEKPEYTI